jgi:Skp family chaperone for outer membrane proteins
MTHISRSALLIASTILLGGMTISAFADEAKFDKEHPRRAEVNKRLENQDRRIKEEVKEGKMSKEEAAKLHKEDRQIRKEERAMASEHGGHITKKEQKKLNRQENEVSKQIGK